MPLLNRKFCDLGHNLDVAIVYFDCILSRWGRPCHLCMHFSIDCVCMCWGGEELVLGGVVDWYNQQTHCCGSCYANRTRFQQLVTHYVGNNGLANSLQLVKQLDSGECIAWIIVIDSEGNGILIQVAYSNSWRLVQCWRHFARAWAPASPIPLYLTLYVNSKAT